MTKNEEIAHFEAFVKTLPADSYLIKIMKQIEVDVVNSIRNDFAFISWAEMFEAQKADNRIVEERRARIKTLQEEEGALRRELDRMRKRIDDVKSEGRVMARTLGIIN